MSRPGNGFSAGLRLGVGLSESPMGWAGLLTGWKIGGLGILMGWKTVGPGKRLSTSSVFLVSERLSWLIGMKLGFGINPSTGGVVEKMMLTLGRLVYISHAHSSHIPCPCHVLACRYSPLSNLSILWKVGRRLGERITSQQARETYLQRWTERRSQCLLLLQELTYSR